MRKEVYLALALLIAVPFVYSLNMGTVKGYVMNSSNVLEIGSNVTIAVVGCTGTGCYANATTDANGFYIKTNLNIVPGNTVNVSAVKGNAFGSNSGIATGSGSVGVATINVTLCVAPQKPVLNDISDTHDNSLISMSWTTYKTGAEYDEFIYDSETANTSAASPMNKTYVTYTSHTWKVRTCGTGCCSDYASDTFEVTNNLPVLPILTDQRNTAANTISFSWTHPGTDPDGDTVTFDFIIDGITHNNVTSPYEVSELSSGSHEWGVRACDGIECTAFVWDSFSITNSAPAAPTLVDQGHTQSTDIDFEWTNYSDSESDSTHNEFQIATDSSFTTIIHSDTSANSPKNVSFLSTYTLYYWRVRTCDASGACSAYSEDSFFVYACTGTTTISGGRKTKYINETCFPEWECTTWGMCSNGLSARNCKDVNDCGITIPDFYQTCYSPLKEQPKAAEPKEEIPAVPINAEKIIEKVFYWPWWLILIIIFLLGVIYYQYKAYIVREIKVDKTLIRYVENAFEKGFNEEQIRMKLIDSGFAAEEVEYVMRKIKSTKLFKESRTTKT